MSVMGDRLYFQTQYQKMFDALRNSGFRRVDMTDWIYVHPDNSRFIKVVCRDLTGVEVNFNDEKVVHSSPDWVIYGCRVFSGG